MDPCENERDGTGVQSGPARVHRRQGLSIKNYVNHVNIYVGFLRSLLRSSLRRCLRSLAITGKLRKYACVLFT